jgi:5-deoxy-glucuronate isomerase
MNKLLRKQENKEIEQGVSLVHDLTGEQTPLEYIGFKMIDLAPGTKYQEKLGKQECCVVAVTGKISVTDQEVTFENIGTRETVFDQIPTDSVYISNDRIFEIEATSQARVALCYSHSDKQLPTKLIKASENGVEHRGTGNNKRKVHNILPDSDPSANSLLVVEVYTESGNWSSYPPHKHDQDN